MGNPTKPIGEHFFLIFNVMLKERFVENRVLKSSEIKKNK